MHDPPTSRGWFGRAISHGKTWRFVVVKWMALATRQNKKIWPRRILDKHLSSDPARPDFFILLFFDRHYFFSNKLQEIMWRERIVHAPYLSCSWHWQRKWNTVPSRKGADWSMRSGHNWVTSPMCEELHAPWLRHVNSSSIARHQWLSFVTIGG